MCLQSRRSPSLILIPLRFVLQVVNLPLLCACMMEARDPSSHSLELQMQAFYEHLRAGYSPHQASPLQQQQSSPHEQQQQQQHHLHHLHYQQLQHHHQHHQQQQQQQHQQQQHLDSPIIHNPAPLRQFNPNPKLNSLNSGPNPNPYPHPNSSSPYPSETPPHTMPQPPPHQLQSATPSLPPSGMGASMNASAPRSAPMLKKKRGRPRKYGTDGNGLAALVVPLNSAPPAKKKTSQGFSKKTQIYSSGATGEGFTPHVLTVGAGEDVAAKIMTFSQHGPWAVCVLSANGVISNASLWHSGISSSSVTYEGRFEILSLSGLFLLTEDGATRTRSGGFSVSLAGQDGSIIGGRVAGLLIAATPIQVVVGTFFPESRKSQARSGNLEGSSHTHQSVGATQPCSPPMGKTCTASGSAPGHVAEPSAGAGKEHLTPLQSGDWGASDFEGGDTRSHSE